MLQQVGASEPVKFGLAGKEYRLRFTLTALKTLAQDHGVEVMKGGSGLIDALRDPSKFALILYHALLPNHPEVTLAWVEDTFDFGMLMELAPVLAQAISGGKHTSPNEEGPASKANGVGLLSGPSGDSTSDSPSKTSGA